MNTKTWDSCNAPISYIGVIRAKEGQTLLGGVRFVKSSPFSDEQDARDWVSAMADQKNADPFFCYVRPSRRLRGGVHKPERTTK